MNLNLTHELLLGPAPLQTCLLYDLGGRDSLVFALHKLITLCEATFSKKLPFDVLSVADLPILMLNALFHNLRTHLP